MSIAAKPSSKIRSLVLLHFFGSSRKEWETIRASLPAEWSVLAVDMPGFGDQSALGARDVAAMVDYVDRCIVEAGLTDCIVVGHSMSGKVARVLASRQPAYLHGLVLLTPSPPSPEPFEAPFLEKALAYDGSREGAEWYVDSVTEGTLPDELLETAIADVMRASLDAWKTWLGSGSQEDWAAEVGVLAMPTLVIAASHDPSLGEDAQRRLTMPHLAAGRLVVIKGGHALPYENPEALLSELMAYVKERDATAGSTTG